MQTQDQELNYFLEPGSIFTCWQPYRIATVLGSGVSICLTDTVNKISGMNNVALARQNGEENITKFANYSIPQLLEMMFELGADKKNIEAHIVGGSYSKKYLTRDIGKETVKEAKKILKKYKIPVVNDDTGGTFGRKVLFDTSTGEIIVYKSRELREKDWHGNKSIDYR